MPDRIYSPSLKSIGITKVIWTHFKSKKLFHIRCNIIFNFEHLRVRACIFLWWIETELSFLNRSWNEDDLPPYVILNTLPCKEFILLLKPLLRTFRLRDNTQIEMLTNVFTTVYLFQDICMKQLLLKRWVFDLLFYRVYLCDLWSGSSKDVIKIKITTIQRYIINFESIKLYLISFYLKDGLSPSKKFVFIYFYESPLKAMKKVFVLGIFTFSFLILDYVGKQSDKKAMVNFKVYDVTDWAKNNDNTNIAQYLKN